MSFPSTGRTRHRGLSLLPVQQVPACRQRHGANPVVPGRGIQQVHTVILSHDTRVSCPAAKIDSWHVWHSLPLLEIRTPGDLEAGVVADNHQEVAWAAQHEAGPDIRFDVIIRSPEEELNERILPSPDDLLESRAYPCVV